jgi:hypothetical protein
VQLPSPSVDGMYTLAAGYMELGHWGLLYTKYMQYYGIIHHLEMHSDTLSEKEVLDVVGT